jgi:hypothetical protein
MLTESSSASSCCSSCFVCFFEVFAFDLFLDETLRILVAAAIRAFPTAFLGPLPTVISEPSWESSPSSSLRAAAASSSSAASREADF